MPSEVILPRVDMDMATGKIAKWLVEPGTAVSKGQPLFEIETDKATMEIEAEVAGTIRDLAAAGAADIPVGSVVAWIFAEGEAAAATKAVPAQSGAASAEPVSVPPPVPSEPAEPAAGNGRDRTDGRLRATPLARRLARMDGIDLGSLTGSGPRGRIQAADVTIPRGEPQPLAPLAETRSAPVLRAPEPRPDTSSPVTVSGPQHAELKRMREGSGRPLAFVHGFGAETNGWRPFLQGRTGERPAYGLDLPGHGTTPLGTLVTFDDLVESVGASLADLEGADVVAHSLGAGVMAAVTARGLADIRSLLLLAPAGLGPEINGGFVQGFLDARSEASLATWMHELVADPQAISPAFVRATLKLRAGTTLDAAQRRLAATLFPDGTQAFSIRADLARLRVPTRIVFGTADKIIPARHSAGLPPLVALHLLPGVGHMPHIEAPDTIAEIMRQMTPA